VLPAAQRRFLVSLFQGGIVRKIALFMTITVDGFIAKADGGLWDAFPWPSEMQDFANDFYRTVDTAIYGRHTYEAIVPWWRSVAEGRYPPDVEITEREIELATMLQKIKKVVFSRTPPRRCAGHHLSG
jgi:dihydrofolate reductase